MLNSLQNSECSFPFTTLHVNTNTHIKSISISLFYTYLLTVSSFQPLLTLPSSMPQKFFTSLFLRTPKNSNLYPSNLFPTSPILKDQGTKELGSLVRIDRNFWNVWSCTLLFPSSTITSRGRICILKACLWAYITYEDHLSLWSPLFLWKYLI